MHRRHLLKSAVSLPVLTALSGLFPSPVLSQDGKTLIYATGTDAGTLDPQFAGDLPTIRMTRAIHETLVVADAGEIAPLLATQWSVSEDQMTWTFRLRDGVTFHDGTPFTSAAVKASFERLRNPATGSPRISSASMIVAMETPDDLTIVFTTSAPYAPFLAQLSAYPMAIMTEEAAARPVESYSDAPVGTGPFKYESWTRGERLNLVANDSYWGERPQIDRLSVVTAPEDSTRTLMLFTQEAQLVSNVPPVLQPRVAEMPGAALLEAPSVRSLYVAMNWKVAPFDNPKVRQAVAKAIDTEALVQGVMGGRGTRSGSFDSTQIPGAIDLPAYEYDPDGARALLAEAGFPDGFETQFYAPSGRYTNDSILAEAIQAQLAEVGIKITIVSPEFATLLDTLRKREVPIFLMGKGNTAGDMDYTLSLLRASEGSVNYNNYSNPEVDRLIAEQRVEMDPSLRAAKLKQLQEIMYADIASVVLFYEMQAYGKVDALSDVIIHANEHVDFSKAKLV